MEISRMKYLENGLFYFYSIKVEVKSTSDCLNRVDNMIFQKSRKCLFKGGLGDIRNHIEWLQADVVVRAEYIKDRLSVLSVLSQVNHIIERFYSDDDEGDLDEQYHNLKQKILEWYEVINTAADKNQ